jgi:hypothetical protein
MEKYSPQPPVTDCYSASRSSRLRVTRGSDAITPIPPNGFALAARLDFMLSGHVAFPEQKSLGPARATEILARLGEELAFLEPVKPTTGDSPSMDL